MKTILQTIFRFPISILAIFFLSLDLVKFFPTQIFDDNFDFIFVFIFFGGIFTQLLTERNAFWKSKKLLVYSIFSLIFLLYLVFYYLYIDWGYPFIGYKIFTFIFAIPLLWFWKHQSSFFLLKKQVKNDEDSLEIRKSFLDFTLHLLSYAAISLLIFIVIMLCLLGVNALLNYLFSTEFLTYERIARWIALPCAATFFLYSIPKNTQKILEVNFLFHLFFSKIFPISLAFYVLIVFAYFSKIIFLQEKPVLLKEHVYIFMIISLFWWFLSARLIQYKSVFFHYFHRYFFWAFFIFMLLNYYFYYVEITIWSREVVFISIIYVWGILLSIYFLIYGVRKIIHFPFSILILIWILSFHTAFFLLKNKKDFKIFIEKENLIHTTGQIDQSKLLNLKLLDYVEYMRLVRELLNEKQISFLQKFVFQSNFVDLDQKNDLNTSNLNLQLAKINTFNDLEQKLQIQGDSMNGEKIVLYIDNNKINFKYRTEKNSDYQKEAFNFYLENSEKDFIFRDQEQNHLTLQADADQLIFFKNGTEIIRLNLSDFRMKDFLISENTKILFRHISFEYLPNKKIKINSLSGEFISPH